MWSETKIRKSTLNKQYHKIWKLFLWLTGEYFASDFSDNEVFKLKMLGLRDKACFSEPSVYACFQVFWGIWR